jgi:hypothetical protein
MDVDTPQPPEQTPAAAAANGHVQAGSAVVSREQRAREFEGVLNSAGCFLALHSKWRQQRCAEVAANSARFK